MKSPRNLEPIPPTLLALDPSLRGTGWGILSLRNWQVLALGVVITKSRTKQEKRLQTAAEADLRSGLSIFAAISKVVRLWSPMVAVMEAGAGSQSASGAKALARSQQACGDAVYAHLGALPICFTVQAVKKAATGHRAADKDEVEAAVRSFWPRDDLDVLLRVRPPYSEQGQRLPPPGQWGNAFDALSVAHTARDHPTVAALRKMLGG